MIVFADMITNVLSNKINPIETGLFIRGRKKHIPYFYCIVLFRSTKKKVKFYSLLYHQNPNKKEHPQILFVRY